MRSYKSLFSKSKIDLPCRAKELVERLKNNPDVLAIFLFGSYSSGNITPLSDVDLAIVLKDGKEILEDVENVDIITLNSAPAILIHEILSTGKLIHIKEESLAVDQIFKVLDRWYAAIPILNSFGLVKWK